jgi:hypothetical protein
MGDLSRALLRDACWGDLMRDLLRDLLGDLMGDLMGDPPRASLGVPPEGSNGKNIEGPAEECLLGDLV